MLNDVILIRDIFIRKFYHQDFSSIKTETRTFASSIMINQLLNH